MSGNARGPSTAFCSLYRLFQLKPTRHQVRKLLESEDAPHVRAVRGPSTLRPRRLTLFFAAQVGFLYLRYVGEPRTLWSWFEDFFGDAEVRPRPAWRSGASRSPAPRSSPPPPTARV